MDDTLNQRTLDYQAYPTPGKISVTPTKNLANQDDLSLAYSPGVAAACMAIFEQGEDAASKYTSRANLVGVITNGTAVLGLGNIGPLAAKPVMEGKCCLFKKNSRVSIYSISNWLKTIPTNWSTSLRRWNPPWAASTLKISKRLNAFILKRSCASARRFRSSITTNMVRPLFRRPPF